MADVQWLGFDWSGRFYASDYFEQLYGYAETLIRTGLAYVDDLTRRRDPRVPRHADRAGQAQPVPRPPGRREPRPVRADARRRIRGRRATCCAPRSTWRRRTSTCATRCCTAIRHAHHHRTGDAWRIYPIYDYAHPIRTRSRTSRTRSARWSSRITGRSTTGCSTNLPVPSRPQQIEFARLNLTYTVMSKRKLLQLVVEKHVSGWDDPRMPTIVGLRRRGFTPEALRDFCERVGVAKKESIIDVALLEHCVREDLNRRAPRVLAVLRPLKVDHREPARGRRRAARGGEQSRGSVRRHAARAVHPRDLHRAGRLPGGSAQEVLPAQPRQGSAAALRLHHHAASASSRTPTARSRRCAAPTIPTRNATAPTPERVQATIHWVSAAHGRRPKCGSTIGCSRVSGPAPATPTSSTELNPGALEVLRDCVVEPSLAGAAPETRYQFERLGYFVVDRESPPIGWSSTARSRCVTSGRRSTRGRGVAPRRRLTRAASGRFEWRGRSTAVRVRFLRSQRQRERWRSPRSPSRRTARRAQKPHPHRRTPRVPDKRNPCARALRPGEQRAPVSHLGGFVRRAPHRTPSDVGERNCFFTADGRGAAGSARVPLASGRALAARTPGRRRCGSSSGARLAVRRAGERRRMATFALTLRALEEDPHRVEASRLRGNRSR